MFIKGFPPNTTEELIRDYFGKFGNIESVRAMSKEGELIAAMVCFSSPEQALNAKTQASTLAFNGKQLSINFYEIKEIRKI